MSSSANSGRPTSIEVAGVRYPSIGQAAMALGVSHATVSKRVRSPDFPDYRQIDASAPKLASAPSRRPLTFEERKLGRPVTEPAPWKYDGGKQRAPVLDPNFDPPRVVRRVGWRKCMCCSKPMWSEDVVRIRMCLDCGGFGGQPSGSRSRSGSWLL